jgi:hypothetical protein
MQYVACKFRPEDSRSYTYEWDGEPFAIGDEVKVPDRSGDGWKRVTVASVSDQAPPFPCKPIIGRYEPEAPSEAAKPEAGDTVEDDDAFLRSMAGGE